MEQPTPDAPRERILSAPRPDDPAIATPFLNVALAEDEEVEWEWTHRDGRSVVTGYRIIKRAADAP